MYEIEFKCQINETDAINKLKNKIISDIHKDLENLIVDEIRTNKTEMMVHDLFEKMAGQYVESLIEREIMRKYQSDIKFNTFKSIEIFKALIEDDETKNAIIESTSERVAQQIVKRLGAKKFYAQFKEQTERIIDKIKLY